jgi:RecB family exonuclease
MTSIVTIRASSLASAFDCPARFEATQLRGLRTPSSGAAQLGTAIHASTALYDKSKLEGSGITIDEAAGAAVDAIHKPEQEVVWADDYTPKEAEKTAVALHSRYCKEIAPKQDYVAVEANCERLEIVDLGIALTGTTDRVARVGEGYGIRDLKSGKTAVSADGTVKTQGHALQLAVYELLAERAAGVPIAEPAQIIGLTTGKTERGQRVAVSNEITGVRDILLGDEESPGALEVVARMVKTGVFFGNPRSQLCSERYCPVFNVCRWRK